MKATRFKALVPLISLAPALCGAREFREVFSDLKEKTAAHSPDTQTAQAQLRQRGGEKYSAWTKWAPHITFQSSKTVSRDYSFITSGQLPTQLFGPDYQPPRTDLLSWSLNAAMPLYDRVAQIAVEQAIAEKEVAEQQLTLRQSEQDWKLRQYLGNYLLAAYRIATAKSAAEAAQASFREAKIRFDLGQKTKIDVLKAESNLTSLEAKVTTTEQQLVLERNAFLDYTGLDAAELDASGLKDFLGSEEKLNEAITAFTENSDRALASLKPYLAENSAPRASKAIDSGLNYRTILTSENLSDIQAGSVMAQEWPQLLLKGSFSKQAPDWGTTYSGPNISYSFGVTLSVPIFSGGSLFSSYREMSATREAARVKSARDTRSLLNEIESENVQIQALSKALEADQVRVARDTEVVRLSFKSYQLGKTTTLELLSAQNDLLSSKMDLAETRIKLAVLSRQFAWNLGVGIE